MHEDLSVPQLPLSQMSRSHLVLQQHIQATISLSCRSAVAEMFLNQF